MKRLLNYKKYNKEESILQLYNQNANDFDSVKNELKVAVFSSMYELIIDSEAASLYVQAFLDRKSNMEDHDDGATTTKNQSQRENE